VATGTTNSAGSSSSLGFACIIHRRVLVTRGCTRHTVVNTKGELTDEDVNAPLREYSMRSDHKCHCFAQHYTQTNLVSNTSGVVQSPTLS